MQAHSWLCSFLLLFSSLFTCSFCINFAVSEPKLHPISIQKENNQTHFETHQKNTQKKTQLSKLNRKPSRIKPPKPTHTIFDPPEISWSTAVTIINKVAPLVDCKMLQRQASTAGPAGAAQLPFLLSHSVVQPVRAVVWWKK